MSSECVSLPWRMRNSSASSGVLGGGGHGASSEDGDFSSSSDMVAETGACVQQVDAVREQGSYDQAKQTRWVARPTKYTSAVEGDGALSQNGYGGCRYGEPPGPVHAEREVDAGRRD